MFNILGFFQFGQLGFWLLILSLISVITFYVLDKKIED
jgi:hypothetical protein